MSERILEKLEPVRRRQLGLEILRFAAMGLLAGSLLGVGLGVWRWQGPAGGARTASGPLAILLAGPALGALVGLARGRSARAGGRRRRSPVRAQGSGRLGRRLPPPRPAHADARAPGGRRRAAPRGLDPRRVAPFRVPAAVPVCRWRARPRARASCSGRGRLPFRPSPPSRSRPSWPPPTRPRRASKTSRRPPRRRTTPSSKSWCRSSPRRSRR